MFYFEEDGSDCFDIIFRNECDHIFGTIFSHVCCFTMRGFKYLSCRLQFVAENNCNSVLITYPTYESKKVNSYKKILSIPRVG